MIDWFLIVSSGGSRFNIQENHLLKINALEFDDLCLTPKYFISEQVISKYLNSFKSFYTNKWIECQTTYD